MKKSKLFQEFEELKAKYPKAIILVEVQGYYMSFDQDAREVVKICDTPLIENLTDEYFFTGFDLGDLYLYLEKLAKAGHRVAIASRVSLN